MTKEQKDELRQWRQTNESKKSVKQSKQMNFNVSRKDQEAIREAAEAILSICSETGPKDEVQEKTPASSPPDSTEDKKRKASCQCLSATRYP